jgi:hypothetical protein
MLTFRVEHVAYLFREETDMQASRSSKLSSDCRQATGRYIAEGRMLRDNFVPNLNFDWDRDYSDCYYVVFLSAAR